MLVVVLMAFLSVVYAIASYFRINRPDEVEIPDHAHDHRYAHQHRSTNRELRALSREL